VLPMPRGNKLMSRLKEKYKEEVIPAMIRDYSYKSVMQVPRLKKVVVNIGIGEATQQGNIIEAAERDLTSITGQHPVITRAKRPIAGFKLRKGMPIGIMVTLRGDRMYDFFDKLVSISLPRLRDFQGISGKAFDGRGNYTLGLKEQIIFPEIEYDKVDKVRGMEISIVTTARNNEEGRRFLELMGMPFSRESRADE
jgi:large subunit ribosomal protein L5